MCRRTAFKAFFIALGHTEVMPKLYYLWFIFDMSAFPCETYPQFFLSCQNCLFKLIFHYLFSIMEQKKGEIEFMIIGQSF
ncbi:MAG: hypothetical protein Ct9H300mP28_30170 [Pseudomonadota bacterium]|nr:MAG: hypothetical protein Ct9H300mP28_30170 [Pseudomonadota bacterium]